MLRAQQRISLLKKTQQIEENGFKNRLEAELLRLKHKKPELFQITGQEQLTKLTTELGISLIRWLIE